MELLLYGLLFGLGAVYLVMAVGVTRLVARSDHFDSRQKLFQYLIIWLVPILGAAFVVAVLGPDIPRRRQPGFISLAEAIFVSAFLSSAQDALTKGSGVDVAAPDATGRTEGDSG